MGGEIFEEKGYLICETDGFKGAEIALDFPSVGATENIMLASVFAKGQTIISNAAREPEIVDLQNFLNQMGADVRGAGSDTVVINGVKKLRPVTFRVMPDRIVAGTYLIAAAVTKGEIKVNQVDTLHLLPIISKLRETGCQIVEEKDSVYLKSPPVLQPVDIIRTHPHPGFPTDMQPQFMSLLTLAGGTSIIIETVFESRFKHISELLRMGADVSTDGRTAVVRGVRSLNGTCVTSFDLRGGAALILAGLAAEDETVVLNSKFVERGYEKIENALSSLGADIVLRQTKDGMG